jgi:uncharacterized membrane protein
VPAYESSIVIAAPAEAVWRVLSDVVQWPQWLPTVASVEALDQKTLHVGSRFVIHQPKLRPATWTVSEIEELRRFAWVARSPGLHMVAEHSVTKDSPATSRVVLRFTFAGLLGGIIGRLFSSLTRSYLAQEAASLKQRVESQAASAVAT